MYINQSTSDLLTLDEFAEYLSISKSNAYSLLLKGIVKGIKVGRIWRIPRQSIEEYISKSLSGSQ